MKPPIPFVDSWIILPLVCVYAFLVQFGNLFRFSTAESVAGVSSVIGGLVILLSLGRAIRLVLQERCYLIIGTLLLWIAVVTVVTSKDLLESGYLWIGVAGYLMLSAAVGSSHITEEVWIRRFWMSVGLGIFISAGLTIVDYMGIADVPYNNEGTMVTELGQGGVEQAQGFFPRRSAMAATFSVSIGGLALASVAERGLLQRMAYGTSAIVGTVCLLLTHNRSGILSVALSLYCFTLFSKHLSLPRRIKTLMAITLLLTLIFGIMYVYFPKHIDVFLAKLPGYAQSTTQSQSELTRSVSDSDYGRVLLFIHAVTSILDNPIGHGFTPIESKNLLPTNPHNLITGIIWATGVFSFLWIPWFTATMFSYMKMLRRDQHKVNHVSFIDVTAIGMLAWLLHNMSHYSLNTGLVWILLGVLISYSRRLRLLDTLETVEQIEPANHIVPSSVIR